MAQNPNVGDAGLSWLKKSYERCVQQAKEEGRPLEELAAERWGVSELTGIYCTPTMFLREHYLL